MRVLLRDNKNLMYSKPQTHSEKEGEISRASRISGAFHWEAGAKDPCSPKKDVEKELVSLRRKIDRGKRRKINAWHTRISCTHTVNRQILDALLALTIDANSSAS